MAGLQVTRSVLDTKSAEAVLAVREAFDKVAAIAAYLSNVQDETLTGIPLGYDADEVYLLRTTFEQLDALQVQPILDTARKLTGLE